MVGDVDDGPDAAGETTHPLVAVVDDDESVRESLPAVLKQLGYSAQVFSSSEAFLASDALTLAQCLVVDVAMPGMTGPELHQELRRRGVATPVVFITGQADVPLRRTLMSRGAVACLFKPFTRLELITALRAALPGATT